MATRVDFGADLEPGVFGSADAPGTIAALPHGIVPATDAGGRPLLQLERFRRSGGEAYGTITAHVRLSFPDATRDGRAITRQAVPTSGTLQVRLTTTIADDGGAVELPTAPARWDGALSTLWSEDLNPSTIAFLIDCLRHGELPLSATGHFAVSGIAPRLPLRVAVDLAAALDALTAIADQRVLGHDSLRRWVLDQLTGPADILRPDDHADPVMLTEVLCDWFRAQLGSQGHDADSLVLPPLAPVDTSVWNLADTVVTWRPHAVAQDLRPQLRQLDPDVHIRPGTTLPKLDPGWHDVDVLINLSEQRVGILACGVDLLVPARPPQRPHASMAAASGSDHMTVTLRLAPGEPLQYSSTAWSVLSAAGRFVRHTGPTRQQSRRRLVVGPADFDLHLICVAAERALTERADVHVALVVDGEMTAEAMLGPGAAEAVFCSPPTGDAELHVSAHNRAGRTVTFPVLPAESILISLASVPGWGPHEVEVRAPGQSRPIEVELKTQNRDPQASASRLLQLSPAQPIGSFRYFAPDPFQAGYLYRVGTGPWVGPLAPDELLELPSEVTP